MHFGQDKEGNEITFLDVIESKERSVEDTLDLKFKIKKLYQKISEVLLDREKMIIELRFGLNGKEPKTQNEIAKELRDFEILRVQNRNKSDSQA